MVDVGDATYVDNVAPVIGPAQLAAEYHWKLYGAVPPEGLADKMTDWPLSIVGPDGVMDPATSAALTPTVSPAEHCETGEKAESVTEYEYVVCTEGFVV